MEKGATSKMQSESHQTIMGLIFKTIFNLILLTIISWMLLTLWFCMKQFMLMDGSVGDKIQAILDCSFSFTSYGNCICKNVITPLHKAQNVLRTLLSYIVDYQLNENLIIVITGSIEITIIRLCIFILSMPFFAAIYFLFIVDGLVQRDIRKFQGARESAFFFHRIKSFPCVCLLLLFFIYMVLPIPILPGLMLDSMVLVSGFFTMLSIKSYKKYL